MNQIQSINPRNIVSLDDDVHASTIDRIASHRIASPMQCIYPGHMAESSFSTNVCTPTTIRLNELATWYCRFKPSTSITNTPPPALTTPYNSDSPFCGQNAADPFRRTNHTPGRVAIGE